MNVAVLTWFGSQWTQYKEGILRFLAVAIGVLSQDVYEGLKQSTGYRLDGFRLIFALMGALVTFPTLQQTLEQKEQIPCWMHLLIAFQYGFCWRTVVGLEG